MEYFLWLSNLIASTLLAKKINYNGVLSQALNRLVVSGGAERHRRTTRRCIRKIMEDIIVRRILGNAGCMSIDIFVNVPSIKNIP